MVKMLNFNDGEVDEFFDSVDCFRNSDSVSYEEESGSGRLGLEYYIWIDEPGSVVERRERFLRGMGFTKFVHPKSGFSPNIDQSVASPVNSVENLGLERITACSGAVRSSSGNDNRVGEEASCSGRDTDERTYSVDFDVRRHKSDRKIAACKPEENVELWSNSQRRTIAEGADSREQRDRDLNTRKEKIKNWWNRLVHKRVKEGRVCKSEVSIKNCRAPKANRMKVQHNKKRCKEFSAVYMGQEIQAHKGFIWTMKFSPDGQYLASGGEDGVIRIWVVTSTDASSRNFTTESTSEYTNKAKVAKMIRLRIRSKAASIVIPQKVFKIEESPLQEFHGHTSDILDLCWSKSNCLLSSSKDKTVRLWQVGFDDCLQVFRHNNYVTCIQFNPVDDRYFISGSIDGKVRIWGVSESRVVDWADIRDIITAISYQPDGQGFVVGSITGHCRFYDASGNNLQLDAQISIQGGKKSSSKRITGFQFSPEDSQRVMITSADSKVRIFDGVDVIHKYRGLRRSGSQMSASFTSNGRHIISLGEDSRVYVWNYDGMCVASSKQTKTVRSCEHFFHKGASVATPWLGTEQEHMDVNLKSSSESLEHQLEATSLLRDSERFSLGGWFSMDGRLRGSTWPEEKLPSWTVPVEEVHHQQEDRDSYHQEHHQQEDRDSYHQEHHHPRDNATLCATWGLVIVTGSWDGVIRTFHNYGLPLRI